MNQNRVQCVLFLDEGLFADARADCVGCFWVRLQFDQGDLAAADCMTDPYSALAESIVEYAGFQGI